MERQSVLVVATRLSVLLGHLTPEMLPRVRTEKTNNVLPVLGESVRKSEETPAIDTTTG